MRPLMCALSNPHASREPDCGYAAGILSWSDGYQRPTEVNLCAGHAAELGRLKIDDSGDSVRGAGIRREIRDFARIMEHNMRAYDDEKGDGWQHEPPGYFQRRLIDELGELVRACRPGLADGNSIVLNFLLDQLRQRMPWSPSAVAEKVVSECADIANFCMMLAWRVRKP